MPRAARIIIPNIPHHITHRSNDKGDIFEKSSDFIFYLETLVKATESENVQLNTFCIMSNHIHLIMTPSDSADFSRVMAKVQGAYSRYYNFTRGISGHLWNERFYSCPIGEEWLGVVVNYILENPVRARMVVKKEDYSWSSCSSKFPDSGLLERLTTHMYRDYEGAFAEDQRKKFKRSTTTGKFFGKSDTGACHQRT